MKTRCPACGATTSLDALLGHSDASQAFVASLNLTGELANPLVKYLSMFRSDSRDLTFERVAKLLNEIAPDIVAKKDQAWSSHLSSTNWRMDMGDQHDP